MVLGVSLFAPHPVARSKEVRVLADSWMQQMTLPFLASLLCPAPLKELATLLGMPVSALLTLDASRAPVFKEQLAHWSVVLQVDH